MNDWLKNFWYAVALDDTVSSMKQPLQVTVLGQRLALFLDEKGELRAVNDICPHMGASLSAGSVKDGKLVCPYHFFEFSGTGRCTKVPSIDSCGKIPVLMAVDSYPVQKRYGLIWVFLGDQTESERAPMVEIPEFSADNTFRSVASEFDWTGSLRPMVENLLDFSHFSSLHGNSFGNEKYPFVGGAYKVITGAHEVSTTVKVKLNESTSIFPEYQEGGANPDVDFESRFYMPSLVINSFQLGPHKNTTLWTFTPVDQTRVRIRSVGVRNYQSGSSTDEALAALGKRIYEEDRSVVETCVPEVLPTPVAVPVDRYVLACRNMYGKALQNGYAISKHMFPTCSGRSLTVIPSPVRKEIPAMERAWHRKEEGKHDHAQCEQNVDDDAKDAEQR